MNLTVILTRGPTGKPMPATGRCLEALLLPLAKKGPPNTLREVSSVSAKLGSF